jgi:HEAT repeat protein
MNKKIWCVMTILIGFFIIKTNFFAQTVQTSTVVVEQINPFDQAVKDSTSSDPYTRRRAAEQFGMLRDIRAVSYLKKLLKDENPFVRQAAIESLGLLRTRDVVDEIVNVLETDKEVQVRQSAVIALGYIGDPKVVPVLTKILKSETEPVAVKYSICNTLSIIASTEAVPTLIELKTTKDRNLRRSVLYALGKIPHPESVKALREAIDENLDDESIVVDIIRSLVDIGDKDSIEKFKILYSTPTASQKIKFYSAYALAKLQKDTSVLPTIKKELSNKDDTIRQLAVDAIRFIGDKESLDILRKMKETETSAYTKQLIDAAIKQLEAKFPKIEEKNLRNKK